jgi:hypothetical protein
LDPDFRVEKGGRIIGSEAWATSVRNHGQIPPPRRQRLDLPNQLGDCRLRIHLDRMTAATSASQVGILYALDIEMLRMSK